MSYLIVENFKFGLDSRKFMLNSPAGTLTTLTNGHITPGGEIEKRKMFSRSYLPANCYGLEVTEDGLTVFGSVAEGSLTAPSAKTTTHRQRVSNVATLTFASHNFAVGDTVNVTGLGGSGYTGTAKTITAVTATTISYANTGADEASTADTGGSVVLNYTLPSGVTYQRLAHPEGDAMVGVIHSTVYNGKAFVIADYGAGGIISWYDEAIVDDLSPGKLATILADADALAGYIAAQIDATDTYTGSASTGTVTVTGPTGQTFSVEVSNDSACTSPIPHDHGAITAGEITLSNSPDDRLYCTVDGTVLIDETIKLGGSAAQTTYDLMIYSTNTLQAASAVLHDGGSGLGGSGYVIGDILVIDQPGVVIQIEVTNVDGGGAITAFDIIRAGRLIYGYGSVGAGNYYELLYPNQGWSNPGSGAFLNVTLEAATDIAINDGSVLVFKTKDIVGVFHNTVAWTVEVTYEDLATYTESGGTYTTDESPVTTEDNLPAYYDSGTCTLGSVAPTITTSVVSDGTQPVSGTIPQAQFTINAVAGAGSGNVTSVTVGGTELLGSPVNDSGLTAVQLAAAVADEINTTAAATITASNVGPTVVLRASDPATYSNWTNDTVVVTVDDDICIGDCAITFSIATGTTPSVSTITADGVDISGGGAAWNTDLSTTIADVATAIKTNSAVYTAVAVGTTLHVSKLITSSADATLQVVPTGSVGLLWVFTNNSGNDGVQGGTLNANVVLSATDLACRARTSNYDYRTDPVDVTVVGGVPPYVYLWEPQGSSTITVTVGYGNEARQAVSHLIAESPNSPSTVFKPAVGRPSPFSIQWRCKIFDALNRSIYSPAVTVHYP